MAVPTPERRRRGPIGSSHTSQRRAHRFGLRTWTRRGLIVASAAVAGASIASAALVPNQPAVVSTPAERLDRADPDATHRFRVTAVDVLDNAWALAFVPASSLALITERTGRLLLRDMQTGVIQQVAGVPRVDFGGQGGLGDVIVDHGYNGTSNRTIYLSWSETGSNNTRGAAVGRARLDRSNPAAPRLTDLAVIWRQAPKTSGFGHYGHRLALSPDGGALFITSGDRQLLTPAQDPTSDLGKIIRYDLGTGTAERWTLGHRNPLGIAFAPDGTLWSSEMGPRGGDELNLIVRGSNYGWPNVSNGSHYNGTDIPDHRADDGYRAPAVWWNPSISPGSLMIYRGTAFPNWAGDAFLGALSGQALVRVNIFTNRGGTTAKKAEQWGFGARLRVVVEDPRDGTIWLIEDGPGGRLLHLTPA